ncbi:MAG: hypothetical protein O3B95_08190 [Chloroflexi bacterium]|nr:hypothetical protein [Chloroflexota bacterium]
MGYIPPGPQQPFSKDRKYGQEPGFVSRNVGKIIIVAFLFVLVAGVALYVWSPIDDDDQGPAPEATQSSD